MSKTVDKSEENLERVLRKLERGDVGNEELQKVASNNFFLGLFFNFFSLICLLYFIFFTCTRYLNKIQNGDSGGVEFI